LIEETTKKATLEKEKILELEKSYQEALKNLQ
jgi:hypothetical protein